MKNTKPMKKTAFAIFAHPDDEAFGPAGTLALLSKEYDVHLICITRGDAHYAPGDKEGWKWDISICDNYAKIRKEELTNSAKALGVKQVHFLEWTDGSLSNSRYHELAEQLKNIIDPYKPELLITFEPRGLTGHADHIITTSVISFMAPRLDYVKRVMYFCFNEAQRSFIKDYFIYFPPGYTDEEVDMEVDVSSVWDKRIASIYSHQSQRIDIEFYLPHLEGLPKKECFLIKDFDRS